MPDLFLYLLTGRRQAEFTIASTGQMVNPYTGDWDRELIHQLGLPLHLFCPISIPGRMTDPLSQQICDELGVDPDSDGSGYITRYSLCGGCRSGSQ
jgi:rhamnulokinase